MKANLFRKYLLMSLVALFLLPACDQPPQKLSDEEAIGFAKELQGSIKKDDGEFLDNSIDKASFIARMNMPDNSNAKDFTNGLIKNMKLGNKISSSLADRDEFAFIKHYIKAGKHHLIYRLFGTKEGTLNYHDYELIKVDNAVKIADVYIYLSGEPLSETMGNLYRDMFEKSTSSERKAMAGVNDMGEVRSLYQKGKYSEAKKMYGRLPEFIKKNKAVMLMDILISSNLSNEEYNEALTRFREKFPNEPNMNLMMIDGYFLQKEYRKMLDAINGLDAQIDKDPILDYYRYLSYNLLDDETNAKIHLIKLINNMPDFQKGYQELIAIELENNNKTASDSLINIYRKNSKFNQEELDNILGYYE